MRRRRPIALLAVGLAVSAPLSACDDADSAGEDRADRVVEATEDGWPPPEPTTPGVHGEVWHISDVGDQANGPAAGGYAVVLPVAREAQLWDDVADEPLPDGDMAALESFDHLGEPGITVSDVERHGGAVVAVERGRFWLDLADGSYVVCDAPSQNAHGRLDVQHCGRVDIRGADQGVRLWIAVGASEFELGAGDMPRQ